MSEVEAETRSVVTESQQLLTAASVRRRLTLCLFLSAITTSIMSQVYPKIILLHFDGDDRKASNYRGWLAAAVSLTQLVFVPVLSGVSDAVGRRAVIAGAFVLEGVTAFILSTTPSSIFWATLLDLMTCVCIVKIALSQAIMIDISSGGGRGATHGLGIAYGARALALSVGDIVGGSLSERYRSQACLIGGGLSMTALLSLVLFEWKETAPQRVPEEDDAESDPETTASVDGSDCEQQLKREGKIKPKISNPLSILTVFIESRLLLQIALSYFLFILSLNVFAVGYNYLDFRFHWSPLEISYFFATFNALMALVSGFCIRFIVPRHLSEENGALFGICIQGCAGVAYGLCYRGWMLFPALVFGALQNITEPCLQAIMATFVTKDRQGSLQGAVTSLRIIGEGVAAPIFTHAFSAGCLVKLEQAPFFLAAIFSFVSLTITWWPLRKMDKRRRAFDNGTSGLGSGTRAGASGDKAAAIDKGEAAEIRAEESESADADEDTTRLVGLGATVNIQASDGFANGRAAESEVILREEEFLRGGVLSDDGEGAITQPLLAAPAPAFEGGQRRR